MDKKIQHTLNDLIEIARDGSDFYTEAAGKVGNPELAALFQKMAGHKRDIVSGLTADVAAAGGDPADHGTMVGSVRQVYAKARAAIGESEARRPVATTEIRRYRHERGEPVHAETDRDVSVERVASGLGLVNVYEALASIEGRAIAHRDEKALWAAALAGGDSLAAAALDRFCLSLGTVSGDIALAQGAKAVVIAGGVGLRVADHLPRSGFRDRFIAKGRFERIMDDMPVKLITHPQPGLYGAAAACAESLGH